MTKTLPVPRHVSFPFFSEFFLPENPFLTFRYKPGENRGRGEGGGWDRRVIGLDKKENFIIHELFSWQL